MSHWTGIYWNGHELGFKAFQEVVRRLHARFDNLRWMKLSEIARYWAAKALTRIEWSSGRVVLDAPFACPLFTVHVPATKGAPITAPRVSGGRAGSASLRAVPRTQDLSNGTWCDTPVGRVICLDLPRGRSEIQA